MANRKFLIESIMGLAQKLGANPNKFMGTKTNINFLGTGDRGMKGTTFSGLINEEVIGATNTFGKSDLVKIIEQDMGYVTAGKLNDVQLNTMFRNLKTIDNTFNPPPGPANIIDLETGTMNINKEGLESLRETDKIKRFTQGLKTSKTAMSNKIKEGIEGLKTKIKAPFNIRSAVDDIEKVEKKAAEESFLRTGAADFTDSIQAEGARRAVVRQVLAKDPDFFMLPPETVESMVKFKDLQRGGANAPDPLVVFRNMGNFTDKELKQIDFIIDQKLFDDTSVIADDVLEYIKTIRPEGFRPGFRSGRSVKGIAELLKLTNKKFGKDTLKTADKIDRPEAAKLRDEFERFNKRSEIYGGPYSDKYNLKRLEDANTQYINVDDLPIEKLDAEALMVKYPGIPERLAKLIGEDTNLQRKAEAIAAIEQAMALKGAGKSADETIAILKSESKTKMSKGGLARILEM
jgi:hypothetical protein